MQHEVDPGPRLAILGLLHLPHLIEPLQAGQIGLEGTALQDLKMHEVQALVGREAQVARKPLIEPERNALEHRVQERMREFVAKVGP